MNKKQFNYFYKNVDISENATREEKEKAERLQERRKAYFKHLKEQSAILNPRRCTCCDKTIAYGRNGLCAKCNTLVSTVYWEGFDEKPENFSHGEDSRLIDEKLDYLFDALFDNYDKEE